MKSTRTALPSSGLILPGPGPPQGSARQQQQQPSRRAASPPWHGCCCPPPPTTTTTHPPTHPHKKKKQNTTENAGSSSCNLSSRRAQKKEDGRTALLGMTPHPGAGKGGLERGRPSGRREVRLGERQDPQTDARVDGWMDG